MLFCFSGKCTYRISSSVIACRSRPFAFGNHRKKKNKITESKKKKVLFVFRIVLFVFLVRVCIDLELRWLGTCSSSVRLCVDWARSWFFWFLGWWVSPTTLSFWLLMALLCMIVASILSLLVPFWSCSIAW